MVKLMCSLVNSLQSYFRTVMHCLLRGGDQFVLESNRNQGIKVSQFCGSLVSVVLVHQKQIYYCANCSGSQPAVYIYMCVCVWVWVLTMNAAYRGPLDWSLLTCCFSYVSCKAHSRVEQTYFSPLCCLQFNCGKTGMTTYLSLYLKGCFTADFNLKTTI